MSKLRLITEAEIESLLDFITPQRGIPGATAKSIVNLNKDKFRRQLQDQKINPKILPKLKSMMKASYENAKVQCGENVGILTAQSFGQLQTQNTLNSFHKAGFAEKTVVSGVPRFSELLNATRSPKGSSCIMHFVKENESIQSLRKLINSTVVEFTLGKLAESMVMLLNKPSEEWYEVFSYLHNDYFKAHSHCVSIVFKKRLLFEYQITLEQIASKIEETYSDLFCVFSPLHMGRLDVFVDTSNISIPEDKVLFVSSDNMIDIYIEDVVIHNLEKLFLCGIKGISNMFYANDKEGKWYIETEGSNFSDVLAHPFVDMRTAMTNDMWEIYATLGIEATRQYLIEELASIMAGINPCHSKLLVDKMTYSGVITSISRYAQRSETNGPLSKASFEETSDNLMNAALFGERECTDGVSASIICGKLGKFGTGVCELRIDVSKLVEDEVMEELVFEIVND